MRVFGGGGARTFALRGRVSFVQEYWSFGLDWIGLNWIELDGWRERFRLQPLNGLSNYITHLLSLVTCVNITGEGGILLRL